MCIMQATDCNFHDGFFECVGDFFTLHVASSESSQYVLDVALLEASKRSVFSRNNLSSIEAKFLCSIELVKKKNMMSLFHITGPHQNKKLHCLIGNPPPL